MNWLRNIGGLMNRVLQKIAFSLVAIVALCPAAAIGQVDASQLPPAQQTGAAPPILPAGRGRETFIQVCSQCHSPDVVMSKKLSREGWRNVIETMVGLGTAAKDEQLDDIESYLTDAFPPDAAKGAPIAPNPRK